MGSIAIYALCEFPDVEAVRYVGQSANPRQRLKNHISAYREHNHRRNWIKQVFSRGGAIGCMVIEWVCPDVADLAEQYWIRELAKKGYRLTNGTFTSGPVPKYVPSIAFDPMTSTVLLTLPHRPESEWHENDLAKRGRAMVRAGVNLRAALNELFWQGMEALGSGAVTLQDMVEYESLGRQMQAEGQLAALMARDA